MLISHPLSAEGKYRIIRAVSKYSIDCCLRLAEARRSKGMTQSALAKTAGCMQSAVSMFEKGDPAKLADSTVEKIAGILGVKLEDGKPKPAAEEQPHFHVHGFCPNCSCPSNVPYAVDGRVIFRPVREIASPSCGPRCVECGEVLETCCPSCGAPLNDGACCAACGAAYVTAVVPDGAEAESWARARRAEIRDIRELGRA